MSASHVCSFPGWRRSGWHDARASSHGRGGGGGESTQSRTQLRPSGTGLTTHQRRRRLKDNGLIDLLEPFDWFQRRSMKPGTYPTIDPPLSLPSTLLFLVWHSNQSHAVFLPPPCRQFSFFRPLSPLLSPLTPRRAPRSKIKLLYTSQGEVHTLKLICVLMPAIRAWKGFAPDFLKANHLMTLMIELNIALP